MKKLSMSIAASALLVLGAGAVTATQQPDAKIPRTVQGIDYRSTLPEQTRKIVAAGDYPEDPGDLAFPDGEFTFDMIESWAGEGSNQAALVIQFNDDKESNAIVFGYRWDGQATGIDMLRAVVSANPQLYGLFQYTNVSSPTDPNGGYTINGIGWDADGDGDIALIDTGNGNQVYECETGFFEHPRGYVPGQGGSSDYDYDNWIARDEDDFWGAGWYQSYWSYWVKGADTEKFSYSSWGASGRVLEDGCWDGWNFAVDMMASDWKNFKPAPSPMPEDAKTLFKVNGVYYKLASYLSKTVTVCAPFEMEGETLSSYSGNVEIPATIVDGETTYKVVAIADEAMAGSEVTEVILPDCVTKIGKMAFAGSTLTKLSCRAADGSLKETGIDRFDNITSIGDNAFYGCTAFADLFFPSKIEKLPEGIFGCTAVKEIVLPAHIREVGKSAFEGCASLTSLTVPAAVKTLGESAFADCDALTAVKAESTAPAAAYANTFSEAAYTNATLNVPNGFESTYQSAPGWSGFTKYADFLLPVNVNDRFVLGGVSYKVTALSDAANEAVVTYMPFEGAFNRNNVKAANAAYPAEVVVPETVKYQGKDLKVVALTDSAFYGAANIVSISLPKAIDKIPANLCYDCKALTTFNFAGVVTEIGNNAFSECKLLKTIAMPEGLTAIGSRSFANTKALSAVAFPASLKTIAENAFYGSGLTELTVPENVEVGDRAFNSCTSLLKVKLPASLTKIPGYLFYSCTALETVELAGEVSEIGASAFNNCYKLKIQIPSTVTKIGESAFANCRALTQVTVPASITHLPTSIFNGCSALESVTLSDKLESIGFNAFRSCTKLREFKYFGDEAKNARAVAEGTETTEPAGAVLTMPASLRSIGNNAFTNCTSVAEINLNEGLTELGNNALEGLKQLKSIDLPSTLTKIGDRCFLNCGLSEIVIPASVTSLGSYMAKGCNGDDVKFYVCATTPGTCGSYSFATKDYKTFAPIVVPVGAKNAFEAANNWKKSVISSPEITGITLGEPVMSRETVKYSTVDVMTVPVEFTYNMENLPARFAEACGAAATAAEGSTFTLTYTVPGEEGEKTAAATYSDGNLVFSDLKLKGKEVSTGQVAAKVGENEITSDNFDFASAVIYVEDLKIKGIEGDEIVLNPKHIKLIDCEVFPENAEKKNYSVKLVGAGESKETMIASTYNVRLWDENNKNASYPELSGHRPGECKLVITAGDAGGFVKEYTVKVVDPDRTPLAENTYLDGTLFLNEEWYGHTNGGANYLTKEGKMLYQAYERENPGMSFGCTSQYGAIWNERLIVISKQAADGGDPLPGGGRVVVADAKTLKRLGSIDNLQVEGESRSGDGRSVVGATPSEVYVGTHQGVYIVDIDNFTVTGKIPTSDNPEAESSDLYNGQIGDMVHAGKYVFGIRQNQGVFIIDPEGHELVKTFADANVQGITQSADGMVWVASLTSDKKASRFVCYDPETLEEIADKSVDMPASIGKVTCGWGAWRTTQFTGCQSRNVLWFSPGSGISNGGDGVFYCWEIGTDPSNIKPFFSLKDPKLPAHTGNLSQGTYGTSRYDDRSGEFIVMTTEVKASGHYRYNWTHFVDPATGSIKRSIELEPYYWFQALPIFPDKYAPALDEEFPQLTLKRHESETAGKPYEFDLSDWVSDPDNIDYNLAYTLPANHIARADNELGLNDVDAADAPFVKAALNGKKLTLTPMNKGEGDVVLLVASNGRNSEVHIPVKVDIETGVDGVYADNDRVVVKGNRLYIYGCEGREFTVAGMDGTVYARFIADSPEFVAQFDIRSGVYVLAGKGISVKFVVK